MPDTVEEVKASQSMSDKILKIILRVGPYGKSNRASFSNVTYMRIKQNVSPCWEAKTKLKLRQNNTLIQLFDSGNNSLWYSYTEDYFIWTTKKSKYFIKKGTELHNTLFGFYSPSIYNRDRKLKLLVIDTPDRKGTISVTFEDIMKFVPKEFVDHYIYSTSKLSSTADNSSLRSMVIK